MSAETDIAAIADGGANTAAEVRAALTSTLARADAASGTWNDRILVRQDTAHAADDEFDDSSLHGDWIVVEDTSPNVTVTEDGSVLSVFHPGGDGTEELHAIVRPFSPAGDFQIETALRIGGVSQNHQIAGLIAADGATYGAGGQVMGDRNLASSVVDWRSMDNYNSNVSATANGYRSQGEWMFLRLEYTSSTGVWQVRMSPDGVSWTNHTTTLTRALTVSHVGLAVSTWGGAGQQVFTFEYFRVFE